MKERGLDALQPARALVDQRLAQPGAGAPLEHMRGRDQGLRQPPLQEQRAQPPGVLAVGLGAPLPAPQGAGLDRLGQMRDGARLHKRLAHKQPARAGLHRDMQLRAGEPLRPLAHGRRRGPDAAAPHLARLLVENVEGDLRPVHIKPGYDHHRGLLYSSHRCQLAQVSRPERRRPRFIPPLRDLRSGWPPRLIIVSPRFESESRHSYAAVSSVRPGCRHGSGGFRRSLLVRRIGTAHAKGRLSKSASRRAARAARRSVARASRPFATRTLRRTGCRAAGC
jgi:hypothetical protein